MTFIWYAYALIDAADSAGFEPPSGIDGVPARIVVAGDLAAVAAELDAAGFESAKVDEELDENGWLARALRAHDRVVHEVFARVAVLPLRFGALYASRSHLVDALRTERDRLRRALDGVRDAAEWSIELVHTGQSDVDELDGTAWMMRRRDAALSHETVHRALAACAARTDGRRYLVRRRDEDTFIGEAARLAERFTGTHIKIVGPGPAYHFAHG